MVAGLILRSYHYGGDSQCLSNFVLWRRALLLPFFWVISSLKTQVSRLISSNAKWGLFINIKFNFLVLMVKFLSKLMTMLNMIKIQQSETGWSSTVSSWFLVIYFSSLMKRTERPCKLFCASIHRVPCHLLVFYGVERLSNDMRKVLR